MEPQYFTVNISVHRIGESYAIDISHTDPGSQALVAPHRGGATFDLTQLLSLEALHAEYGKALSEQLFSDKEVQQRFVQVETAAQATRSFLRFSLCIDPSAQELQALRWELLRHPVTGAVLSTSEMLLFSRFMLSRDFRPVKLRASSRELTALVAVSAPTPATLLNWKLAPVDFKGEVARVTAALAGVNVRTLGGPDAPFTLDRLIEALRDGVDVLYLVSHGTFQRSTGMPVLILQNDQGEATPVKGEQLAVRIGELQKGPRLVVLASCQSAGDGKQVESAQRTSSQSTLAGRLADAGVPAVIAMQGFISMVTVEKMMPVFFKELLLDGQVDRALAAARGKVRDRDDAWMPALTTRLTAGRIWYTPGFAGVTNQDVWKKLIKPIRAGKVVPILGPGLLESICGTPFQTARRLAARVQFPLAAEQWDDLPRVTQYLAVKQSRVNAVLEYKDQLRDDLLELHKSRLPDKEVPPTQPNPMLGKLFSLVGNHLRQASAADPYRILANLPASVYLTTNFDRLLESALEDNQRKPQSVVSRWRHQRSPETAATQPVIEATTKEPVVYHAFGAFGKNADDTLVLTEDDYFDFLIGTAADKLVPAEVESALVDNSLVFLGFRLTDWSFRVLFRLMMSLKGGVKLKDYCHVAVQLEPDLDAAKDAEGLRAYLSDYFGKQANIQIFWGTAAEFLKALDTELKAVGAPVIEDPKKEESDEW